MASPLVPVSWRDTSTQHYLIPTTPAPQALELISTEVPLPRPGPLRAQGMDRNNGAGRGPGGGEGAGEAPCRALGPALQALFDYVVGFRDVSCVRCNGVWGLRLFAFACSLCNAVGQQLPLTPQLHSPAGPPQGGNRTAGASGGGGGAGGASPLYLGQLNLMLMISGPSDIGPGRTLFSESEEAAYAAASPTRNTGGGARPGEPASGPGAAVAEGRAFYEQAAVAAASVGACVDVFAVAGVTVGLQVCARVSVVCARVSVSVACFCVCVSLCCQKPGRGVALDGARKRSRRHVWHSTLPLARLPRPSCWSRW